MRLLAYLSILSSIFPLLPFFFKGRLRREWIVFSFVLVAVATELISYLMLINKISNIKLLTVYTFLEGFLILLIISQKIEIKAAKLIAYFCISILAIFTFSSFRNNSNNDTLNIIEAFFVLGFSVYYYVYLFQKAHVPVLTQYYFFWINTAFFWYFTTNLFVLSSEHLFINPNRGYLNFFWAYHLVSNIIYNVLFAAGVWKISEK